MRRRSKRSSARYETHRELEKELRRKERTIAEAAVLLVLRKVECVLGGEKQRGRLPLIPERTTLLNALMKTSAGAR